MSQHDPYFIPLYALKSISCLIAYHVAKMVILSFHMGKFASCLKISTILPLFKSGDQKCTNNYRPIAILTWLSKVVERIALRRLQCFLDLNHTIDNNQFGFQKGKNTEKAVFQVISHICMKCSHRRNCIALFLDFQKAFDRVNHFILLNKLKDIGIHGMDLNFLSSYLSGRSICTKINNCTSHLQNINRGVPQGSHLGPVLFLIFINDLCKFINSDFSKTILFADDSTIIIDGDDNDILSNTTIVCNKISQWVSNSNMSLNHSKCKYMFFSHKNRLDNVIPVKINSFNITPVYNFKLLGIIIDNYFSFNHQILQLKKKLSHYLPLFNKLKYLLRKYVKLLLFHASIQSQISYLSSFYINISKNNLLKNHSIHRKIVKSLFQYNCNFSDDFFL